MNDEPTPATAKPTNGDPPEWYWILTFPLGILVRYLFRPDDLSTPWRIVWWIGSLIVALVVLWLIWEIGKRVRKA